MTLAELRQRTDWEEAVIVFTEDTFALPYSEKERSYKVERNCGKYFDTTKLGKSLWGNCLDGTDDNVRLDVYIRGGWKVERCYITKEAV